MPFGDGTRPSGGYSSAGRGTGAGAGAGRGRKGGNNPGAGPGGYCICPKCGAEIPHQQGISCYSITCPRCGSKMTRA